MVIKTVRRRLRRKRTGRHEKSTGHVYLGTRVRDIGSKGYDTQTEGLQMAHAILQDYKKKRISGVKFNQRTAILGLSTIRNKKLSKRSKAKIIAYINFIRALNGYHVLYFRSLNTDREFRKYYDEAVNEIKNRAEKEMNNFVRKVRA